MMFGWTKSKRETGEKQRRSLRPARLGLLVFALICAGIAYWDISANGATGGLTLEQPAVDVNALPQAAEQEKEEEVEQRTEAEEAEALFAAYRLERESSREEELALLQEIMADPAASEEAKSEAEQRKLAVSRAIENEAAAESLLRARGFGETVVLVSGEQATVICDLELTAADASRIANVTAECCGVSFENVIIVNR
ncbi:MAG: SpoIIIAH-like family protein [Firmicutes bacterium]|nr:SpoIIIAH-like family protein [Bacillota bacterium]